MGSTRHRRRPRWPQQLLALESGRTETVIAPVSSSRTPSTTVAFNPNAPLSYPVVLHPDLFLMALGL